jgi:acyl-CoA thioester hydrolase
MDEIQFHHSVPIQLRFNDFDVLGHVNNSVYFTFYDWEKRIFQRFYPGITSNRNVVWLFLIMSIFS